MHTRFTLPELSQGSPSMEDGTRPITYIVYDSQKTSPVNGHIVAEAPLCIHINGQPWVTLMCSPHALDDLVIGYLRSEGLITSVEEVELLEFAPNSTCADVWLKHPPPTLPRRATVTSGCGGGLTFAEIDTELPPIRTTRTLSPDELIAQMRALLHSARQYHRARGIHASALSDGESLVLVAEDVGRHNTVDRLWGAALRSGISPQDHILLTTGRISSEMLRKAAKMRVPLVASRTSPTSLSVELATRWHITLVGYVRNTSFRVYTVPERLRLP